MIEILAPGPYATIQDLGRPGYAHLGVPRSGAADAPSLRLANRLVGNPEAYAGVEFTLGLGRVRFLRPSWVALTGAPCPVELWRARTGPADPASLGRTRRGPSDPAELGPPRDAGSGPAARSAGGPVSGGVSSGETSLAGPASGGLTRAGAGMGAPVWVEAGDEVRIGAPSSGLRTYLAVRGGIAVEPVLGSRSTDSLAGIGPPPLRAGTVLPLGDTAGLAELLVDQAPLPGARAGVLRVVAGPRDDWFDAGALRALCGEPYQVTQDSNRVGVRLRGTELRRARGGELPSEGMVTGAIQVPPSGQPIVFLADHPPTGGYPVIAVVRETDLPVAAQLRPGDLVRFAPG
ncbi:biotin-dependent carboxyltransferase family protein [Nonomuraea sp. NBC_01738]|uniref:5-oxoprolinase subunit C family protein n=1 Tax=Nonomuraea sp. NBC_01738 TaxID=2976003 RepID=UPI002E13AB66|nr:biotin-dependent carboxyltransferase family protein [Nonomuraea sp. NBC_01738]